MATTSPLSPETLDRIRELTEQRARADADYAWADQQWRAFIQALASNGQRVVEIAEAADITPARVYQIRDGRR